MAHLDDNIQLDPEMSICMSEDGKSPISHVTQREKKENQDQKLENSLAYNDFKEEMRKLVTYFMTQQKSEMEIMRTTLQEIRESNIHIQNSIDHLHDQNEEIRTKLAIIEEHAKEDREYILFLENKVENMELGIRKTNSEVKNVPKKENERKEDLIEMVLKLAKTVGCVMNKSDLKDIYRVRGKKPDNKNTPIIIETNSALLKSDLLTKAKQFNNANRSTKLAAKHLGFKTEEDTPIYLSEHLTSKAARLHYLARDLQRSKGYKYCWTNYGKVYVRRTESSQIILIRSEDQVHQLMLQE
ncbi:hypothetical protein O0L34_g13714 [Tuta absoluta]|nr:hypothetical protein O0L34_g13714 [Tuta absoluta]